MFTILIAPSRNNLKGMEWINVAEDSDKRRAVVNTVMNVPVPKNAWKFPTLHEKLFSIELANQFFRNQLASQSVS
jgi:hypothetical protein